MQYLKYQYQLQQLVLQEQHFKKNNAKLYIPVVTLSINDNIKFLEKIKQGFKRQIYWNKYRSKITPQPNNNNLDYLIDPTFKNINRLFFHSKMVTMIPREILLSTSMPLVKIKGFNEFTINHF